MKQHSALHAPPLMTLEEAREFIDSVPWTAVKGIPEGPANKPPDPHEYVILGWREVDRYEAGRFIKLIREKGYKGRYAPPYDPSKVMVNYYLQVDEWCYWFIGPKMLNRCLAELRQHEPLGEQQQLW